MTNLVTLKERISHYRKQKALVDKCCETNSKEDILAVMVELKKLNGGKNMGKGLFQKFLDFCHV